MKLILIGAGGHARNVIEMLSPAGHELIGYVDPNPCAWIDRPHWKYESDTGSIPLDVGVVLGIGGVTPDQLKRRMEILRRYREDGRAAPCIVHPQAIVSKTAALGDGAQIMAGSMLQANCTIGHGAIVNTGAIVEHDAQIEEGVHVAPGAIVLGAVSVGAYAMVGAGSIVLQGASVPAATLVKAGSRFPQSA